MPPLNGFRALLLPVWIADAVKMSWVWPQNTVGGLDVWRQQAAAASGKAHTFQHRQGKNKSKVHGR